MIQFTVDELLLFAKQHETDEWTTGPRGYRFRCAVTSLGVEYVPQTGVSRSVPKTELDLFCEEFKEIGSFAPGKYPKRWHKSYSLPLIKRFLQHKAKDR
jgi:hypothetical protein